MRNQAKNKEYADGHTPYFCININLDNTLSSHGC